MLRMAVGLRICLPKTQRNVYFRARLTVYKRHWIFLKINKIMLACNNERKRNRTSRMSAISTFVIRHLSFSFHRKHTDFSLAIIRGESNEILTTKTKHNQSTRRSIRDGVADCRSILHNITPTHSLPRYNEASLS